LSRLVAADAERDADPETGVGYGVDSLDDQVRMADFKAVRGL
jgi:hypothetical protein